MLNLILKTCRLVKNQLKRTKKNTILKAFIIFFREFTLIPMVFHNRGKNSQSHTREFIGK